MVSTGVRASTSLYSNAHTRYHRARCVCSEVACAGIDCQGSPSYQTYFNGVAGGGFPQYANCICQPTNFWNYNFSWYAPRVSRLPEPRRSSSLNVRSGRPFPVSDAFVRRCMSAIVDFVFLARQLRRNQFFPSYRCWRFNCDELCTCACDVANPHLCMQIGFAPRLPPSNSECRSARARSSPHNS
jgi:hypothetical protein